METIKQITQEEIIRFVQQHKEDFYYQDKPKLTESHKERIIAYLKNEISFDDLGDTLILLRDTYAGFFLSSMNGSLLNNKILIFPDSLSERIIRLQLLKEPNPYPLYMQIKNRRITLDQLVRELESYQIPASTILGNLFTSEYVPFHYDWMDAEAAKVSYVNRNREEVKAALSGVNAETKALLVPVMNNIDSTDFILSIQQLAGDSAKSVRDAVVKVLVRHRKEAPFIHASLSSKKQAVRETAIRVLAAWKDDESLMRLKELYGTENNEKLRSLIESAIKNLLIATPCQIDDLELYCTEKLKKLKTANDEGLPWDKLPKVRVQGKAQNTNDCMKYLTACYAGTGRISVPLEAIRLTSYFNAEDMAQWSMELLTLWHEANSDAKLKWVLPLCAYHGDSNIVTAIKDMIADWPIMGRAAIACEAVRALAVSNKDEALRLVDAMSRRHKSRPVKLAAEQAFAYAANEQGIDPEELADRIIPDYGFSQRGELVISYGERSFVLRLNERLELDLFDQIGTKLKALPKPGAKDNAEQAEAMNSLFKDIKKQLKATAKSQLTRLQSALSAGRSWQASQWRTCFLDNPLMQRFATSLIWVGEAEGMPPHTFRSMEDMSLNTAEDDVYELPEKAIVRLAHPLEMTEAQVEAWQQQLSDYEVKQPFLQLDRRTYKLPDDQREEKYIFAFGGRVLSGLTLMGRMLKLGWTRGLTGDGGNFDTYYREEPMCGYGAQLTFSGMYIAMDKSSEADVTVYELVFYARQDSGVTDNSNLIKNKSDEQRLAGEVPPRFYSDVMNDLHLATADYARMNENWKTEHWRVF